MDNVMVLQMYPTEANVNFAKFTQKLAYVQYAETSSVAACQHLSNTVLVDRIIICVPVPEGLYNFIISLFSYRFDTRRGDSIKNRWAIIARTTAITTKCC